MGLPADGEIPNLAEFGAALFGDGQSDPPAHWISRDVELYANARTVKTSIPADFCRELGIDRDNPPSARVYYDPITELVFFDPNDSLSGE